MSPALSSTRAELQPPLPPLRHVLETCLYVRDVGVSTKFYKELLVMEPIRETPRGAGFALGETTLLLFQLGQTSADFASASGTVPGHGPTEPVLVHLVARNDKAIETSASLRQHFCFAVSDRGQVDAWERHLRDLNVQVLGVNEWEMGGKSVYFRDLDGNVGEVASRGTWPHY